MIIPSTTFAGFQCPVCGKIQAQMLYAFDFAGTGDHSIFCDQCGQPVIALMPNGKKEYQIGIGCPDCGAPHGFPVKRSRFWQCNAHTFACPVTDELLLAIGKEDRVEDLLETSLLAGEGFEEDDFLFPEEDTTSLVQTALHLQALAKKGALYCDCGKPQLQLHMGEDTLLLVCASCKRSLKVNLYDTELLNALLSAPSFTLE